MLITGSTVMGEYFSPGILPLPHRLCPMKKMAPRTSAGSSLYCGPCAARYRVYSGLQAQHLDHLTELIQRAVAEVGSHQLPHGVPGVARHAGQVHHAAHAGYEGHQGAGRDVVVHDDTLENGETEENLLVRGAAAAQLAQAACTPHFVNLHAIGCWGCVHECDD